MKKHLKKHLLGLVVLALTAPTFSTENDSPTIESRATKTTEKSADIPVELATDGDNAKVIKKTECEMVFKEHPQAVGSEAEHKGEEEVLLLDETCKETPEELAETSLPEAKIVDERLDLEKTMRMMGKNFGALFRAKTIEEMKEPLQALSDYTGQAALLGLSMEDVDPATLTDEQKADYQEGMKMLRKAIVELQSAVDANDLEKAKGILETIKVIKEKGHQRFNVG